MKKRISIIGTVGIPAKYGGFETLVENLTICLFSQFDITVYCSNKEYTEKLKEYNNAKLKYINFRANGAQSIIYDIFSLLKAIFSSDVILILGVSGCIILPFIKPFIKNKIITNIDGLEWKRNKWNIFIKKILKFSEKLAVKHSDVVIGDNKVIVEYVKQEYGVDAELIAYGADHVSKEYFTPILKKTYPFIDRKYAFKVCRIEPENNIHIILEAFYKFKQMDIVIIGNWNNSQYGRELRSKYNGQNIYLLDPIYDQKNLNQLRSNCFIYIHGHSAGGTNPSLVEAMCLGLPILAYDAKYNKETTGYECKYFHDSDDILYLLDTLDSNTVNIIGKKMYDYAKIHYSWSNISKKYSNLFNKE